MRQRLWKRLFQIGQAILVLLLSGTIESPIWRIIWGNNPNPGSPLVYYVVSTVSFLLSTLLFYLIWRAPRWEHWNGYRVVLLFYSSCRLVSYLGWFYAPAWGISPLLGHVLGILIGAMLGFGIMKWEDRAIHARKSWLLAGQRGALDA